MTTPHRSHQRTAPIPSTSGALTGELRAWAQGDYGIGAAVDLLITHQTWLRRADFRDACLVPTPAHLVDDFALPRVWLDFDKVADIAAGGRFPASSSERQVLAIAAGLADHLTGWSLHDLVTGLDTANLALVLDAIAHTAGWHEHRATPDGPPGHTHTVTGHVGKPAWKEHP